MSDTAIAATAQSSKKPRQGRSPGYPFIPLNKALERAEKLRIAEGGRPKHFSPRSAIARAWDMGEKTGPLKQTIAALGHFGLFEFQGSGEERAARLTDKALRILLDKQPFSPERDALIREVALAPPIHQELWTKWGAGLPSMPTIETFLVRDRGFSEDGARDLIAEYKATLAYANLGEPAIVPAVENGNLHDEPKQEAVVGDFIQAEIDGVLAFEAPKRVRATREDGGTKWVFVEGHEAGVPMDQVQIIERQGDKADLPPPRLPLDPPKDQRKPPVAMKEEKNSLDEGEAVLVWPEKLSPDSVADLEYWLEGILRKAKRRAGVSDKREAEED